MKPIANLFVVLASAGLAAAAPSIDLSKLPPASSQKNVTYAKDIKPLFEASCLRCHGAERPKAHLRLDNLEGVLAGTKDGPVVVKGDSAKSLLVEAVSLLNPKTSMPPKRRANRGGPGGPGGTNAPSGGAQRQRPGGTNSPPAKPLTAEQVGLVRAWIDQGAK